MTELQELLVNRTELDRRLLAEVLGPFIGIDSQTREIVPQAGWMNLGPDEKILVFLLARKAMYAMKEVELDVEGAAPKDIEAATGVRGGTLRPKLMRMRQQGLLAQDASRRYFVPTHAILRVKDEIVGGAEENGQAGTRKTARRSRGRRGSR